MKLQSSPQSEPSMYAWLERAGVVPSTDRIIECLNKAYDHSGALFMFTQEPGRRIIVTA